MREKTRKQTVTGNLKRFLAILLTAALTVAGTPLTSLAAETQAETEAPSETPSSEAEAPSEPASSGTQAPSSAEETTQSVTETGGGINKETQSEESTEKMTEESSAEKESSMKEESSIEEESPMEEKSSTEEESPMEEESSTEEEMLEAANEFELSTDGKTLKKYNGATAEVTIPDSVEKIGENAFKGNKTITKVIFPEMTKVTTIGSYAFYECTALTEIALPSSVTEIGTQAFMGCTSLKSVTLNDGLAKMGQQAFGKVPFGEENAPGTLTIPATVSEIGLSAFENCKYLGAVVFANEAAAGSDKAPSDTLSTGTGVFSGCTNLQSVTLPNRLTIVGNSMFLECGGLKTVTFGNKVTDIEDYAFQSCGLLEVTLPSTVTKIGDYAFQYCKKLKTVNLNDGLLTIGTFAFNQVPFGEKKDTGEEVFGTLTIPATVTTIGYGAFRGNVNNSGITYLEKVIFADATAEGSGKEPAVTLNTDGDNMKNAFQGHENLKEVKLPQRLEAIPDYMFGKCTKLEKVEFGNQVTKIGNGAFQECGLPEITLPSTVKTIGGYAFSDCKNLKSVKLNEGLLKIGDNVFMKVPFGDSSTLGKLRIPGSVTEIGIGVFNQCEYLKEVVFANTTAVALTITAGIFDSCDNLNTVILPERLKSLSNYFFNTPNLTTVYIPASVTKIENYAIRKTPTLTIYGKSPSAAEKYAKDNDIPFSTDPIGISKAVTIKKQKTGTDKLTDPVVARNKVTQGAKASDGDYDKWSCSLESGAAELRFTIKSTSPTAKPIVKYGAEQRPASLVGAKSTKTATEYTYKIDANDLEEDDVITIAQEDNNPRIILENAASWLKTVRTVSQGGKTYDAKDESGGDIVYEVKGGQELTIRAEQREFVTLKSLSYKIGGTTKKVSASKGVAEITLSDVRADVTITVDAAGGYEQILKEKDAGAESEGIKAVKNIYNVSYDGKYTASAKKAWTENREDAVFTKAELYKDKATGVTYSWKTGDTVAVTGTLSPTEDGKGINVDIGQLGADREKKKWTLKLYEGNGDDETLAAVYTLQAYKPITKVDVKPGAIKQTTDTESTYILSTDGEKARLKDAFTVTVDDKDIVKAVSIDGDGNLLVTTGNKTGPATVKLTPNSGINAPTKTVTVTTTKLLDSAKSAPKAVCEKADDISLTLALTLKKVPKPKDGELFYEIKAKASGSAPTKLKNEHKVYVKRTGDTQKYRLIMQELAGDAQPALGQGESCNYDVAVRLVYSGSKVTDLNGDGSAKTDITVAKYSGGTEEIAGKEFRKVFSTLVPKYENRLQLTKKMTTVYTGQTNVLVATAKFSKDTTYTSLAGFDATPNAGLNAVIVSDTAIKVSPDKDLAPGKYTVTVRAAAAPGQAPSTAKIDITVAKGIETLKVNVPASLTKAPRKAATLKPTVTYNEGKTAPRTRKVEWSITDAEGNPLADGSYLKRMVSINKTSGAVTVNKAFVLSRDNTKNQFTVTATARDFQNFDPEGEKTYNPVRHTSTVITITD